jgi:lipoyl(octanoyl) transferase
MHGFELNCDCDLGWFGKIVPCGIRDAGVTSLSAETGRPVTVADMVGVVQHHLADVLGATSWRQVDGTAVPLPATALSETAR